MVWYIAVIAVLNLGLGYAFAVYLDRAERRAAYASNESLNDDE